MAARKSALITGCRIGGIGNSLAREFHSRGLRVFASARSASQLADLEALGMETFSLDVTSREQITILVAEVSSRTGGTLDILVNNAGRSSNVAALDESDDDLHSVFETNIFSVMYMVQSFSGLLISAKGTIVNIGSVTAYVPLTFGSSYNATKAALQAYSDTLRVELEPFGVKVMVIVTGGVQSNIAADKRTLPTNSLYMPIAVEYARRQGASQVGAMTSADYAHGVVAQVLNQNPLKWYWRGTHTWSVWILSLLPKGLTHWVFRRRYGMGKLRELIRTSKPK